MKTTFKRCLAIVLGLTMSVLTACAKLPFGKNDAQNNAQLEGAIEVALTEDVYVPFTITVTDKDIIYVEVQKDTYDPANTEFSYNAFFLDASGETVLNFYISHGGSSDSRCYLSYGEPGDTSKTAASDYGFTDLGDSVKYTIVLNNPDVTISGGDNLPIPLSLFESIVTCQAINANDAFIDYDAKHIIKYDIDYGMLEAKESGLEKLESMLYLTEEDRKFLTPSCEDYRVDIFDTKAVVFDSCRIDRAPASGYYVFGTDPQGKYSNKPCKVYRVYEFDHVGRLVAYKEKTVFESESDAIHVAATNGVNGAHALYFIDWKGVNEVPADFTDEQGLKAICDEFLPKYYEAQGKEAGYSSDVKRLNNTWYISFVLDEAGFRNKEFFSGIGETEILGNALYAEGLQFSADNADNEGYVYLSFEDEKATIYYSKPEAHKHNITTGSGANEKYPDDFVSEPKDSTYFSPDSDDYVLYYLPKLDYGDYFLNTNAVLISFDASGNIIGAKYRFIRTINTVNPMEELIKYKLDYKGTKLLYSDDKYAYFDIIDSVDLKEYIGEDKYGERFNKTQLLEKSLDDNDAWMPMYGWSSEVGIYTSRVDK